MNIATGFFRASLFFHTNRAPSSGGQVTTSREKSVAVVFPASICDRGQEVVNHEIGNLAA